MKKNWWKINSATSSQSNSTPSQSSSTPSQSSSTPSQSSSTPSQSNSTPSQSNCTPSQSNRPPYSIPSTSPFTFSSSIPHTHQDDFNNPFIYPPSYPWNQWRNPTWQPYS